MSIVPGADRPITHRPVRLDPSIYFSPEVARAEQDRLWPKVWQVACRLEELPDIGDYVTYDIAEESLIVVRVSAARIAAYYNVCQHRGRRLTNGCGTAQRFACRFHGWQWNLAGENVRVHCEEDWEGALDPDSIALPQARVGLWGGFVFVCMDPDAESLEAFLGVVPERLDPFEIDRMRYRWRQWIKFPCNWKVAIEAFNEGYHAAASHPQLTKYSTALTWSETAGRHSYFGVPGASDEVSGGTAGAAQADDLRVALAESLATLWDDVNTSTTQTIVDAAARLADELPADTPPGDVVMHLNIQAMAHDAARGVVWPTITAEQFAAAGIDWHVFPNTVILPGQTYLLGYRARPDGADPQSCIFDVFALERYPEGEEPRVENVHTPTIDEANWRRILCQDFANMGEVQKGMKSRGFKGPRPNPLQERPITNFHCSLADYLGTPRPTPIET